MSAFLWLALVRAAPIAFAALAGVVGERAGVVNIGLEGMLASAAFVAVVVAGATHSALLGAAAGVATGALVGLGFGLLATRLRVDQIVAGTGLNVVAIGAAAYGLVVVYGRPGASPDVPGLGRAGEIALVVVAILATLGLHLALARTPWGLRVRASGENPYAVRSAGVDPRDVRTGALVVAGTIVGLGGIFLSLAELDLYSDGMTAGRGFIALAAVVLGRWTPVGAGLAALAFGVLSALQLVLQGTGVPSEFLQAMPYLVAVLALAGLVGRARPPEADGLRYDG